MESLNAFDLYFAFVFQFIVIILYFFENMHLYHKLLVELLIGQELFSLLTLFFASLLTEVLLVFLIQKEITLSPFWCVIGIHVEFLDQWIHFDLRVLGAFRL